MFVFTGQGSQWPEMGKRLIQEVMIFRSCIRRLDQYLQSLTEGPEWSIEGKLLTKNSRPLHSYLLPRHIDGFSESL